MKIGIDTLFEGPNFPTGVMGYMRNLLRCLARIDRENEYFLFVSPTNRHMYHVEQGNFHQVVCWASNERRNLRIATQQVQSPALARKYGIEVFNSPGNTAPLFLPCPSVLTIKTMHHYHLPETLGWQRALFRRTMIYASAKRATFIIANSRSNRDDIVRFLGIAPERVALVHEAVDRECFRADLSDEQVAATLEKKGVRRPYLLNVSSIWPYKNQLTLVRAYGRLVREHGIPHELVLAGASDQPAYAAQVHDAVKEIGLEGRVRFLGYQPHAELAYIYRGADVFVYPSSFETFGLTLPEAMACGVPIVCSDRGSLPEIAGDAALIVHPERDQEIAAAVWRILSNPKLHTDLVAKGFRRVSDFSWEKTAAETLAVFLRAGTARRNGFHKTN